MAARFARYPSLAGERVLVTSGASGIGASIVEHFADQSSQVGFLDFEATAVEALRARLQPESVIRFAHVDLRHIAALRAGIVRHPEESAASSRCW